MTKVPERSLFFQWIAICVFEARENKNYELREIHHQIAGSAAEVG
jgi:hypothetical protein